MNIEIINKLHNIIHNLNINLDDKTDEINIIQNKITILQNNINLLINKILEFGTINENINYFNLLPGNN